MKGGSGHARSTHLSSEPHAQMNTPLQDVSNTQHIQTPFFALNRLANFVFFCSASASFFSSSLDTPNYTCMGISRRNWQGMEGQIAWLCMRCHPFLLGRRGGSGWIEITRFCKTSAETQGLRKTSAELCHSKNHEYSKHMMPSYND